jgi:two-component system alkaline phosphatase synthesis response regulator PhoP
MSKNKKVVVIDDDLKTIMLVEKVLELLGFQVLSADEGKKGLEMVKKEKPDLLICDLLLPGMHGSELCKSVKQDPELDNVKVVIISAVYNESSYKREMDCKADAFIKKPFGVEDLESLMRRLGLWTGK